jgi:TRAP-type mannitol/chloroaromatic compound transport system substrate-binding protein
MGGWYRKEIKSVADLKNLKFRVGGVAGVILARLGVVPQQIAAGDIYPALERGTIDAAEWIGPHDDEKLGFVKVAKYYYTPGWWEPNSQNSMFVNLKAWDALPKEYQAAFSAACGESNTMCMAKYDHVNPTAMKSLISKGALLRRFPESVLDACYKASLEQYDEWSAKHPEFKTMYDSFNKYLKMETDWFQVSEGAMDNFMVKKLNKSKG